MGDLALVDLEIDLDADRPASDAHRTVSLSIPPRWKPGVDFSGMLG